MNACAGDSHRCCSSPLVVAAGCDSSSKKERDAACRRPCRGPAAKPSQVAEREPVARACRASDLKPPKQVKFVPRLQGGIALVPLRNVSAARAGSPAARV